MPEPRPQTLPNFRTLFESAPGMYLVLRPNAPVFTIVAVSDLYLQATRTQRDRIAGRGISEVFADDLAGSQLTSTKNLRESLERVLSSRAPDAIQVQPFGASLTGSNSEDLEQRHWSVVNFPVFEGRTEVEYIIHRLEDVSSVVMRQSPADASLAERARLAAVGADVGAALTQMQDLSRALHRCAEAMVRHMDAAFARVWTFNEAFEVLELRASAGLYTHLDGPHSRVPLGAFKIGRIALSRQPHLTNDVVNDPEVGDHDWALREGMVSFAGYPLLVEDRLVGVMALFARHPLAQSALEVLGSVADSVAMGIERKRVEEALTRQAEELARSNADLQQFAYITSHDLQEPLRTMISFSQLLNRRYGTQLDEEAKQFLDYIVTGAKRMKQLIESMLSYSRVSNTETMPFTAVPLDTVIHWAAMNMQSVLDETQSVITKGALPEVTGNTVQLVQLFQNLISNAVKYRKSAEPAQISIFAEPTESGWLISVEDNGTGIDADHHERIFGVFKRLHGKEIPGTGIGLAICRKIVERHGGRIWVESAPGTGSAFRFTLPAAG